MSMKAREAKLRRGSRWLRPRTREQLWHWVAMHTPLLLPRQGCCPGHVSPFEYLVHTFLEESSPADTVVWACRGGGKTMLGAVATLLDLLFKPGIEVKILGGSLEQSDRMYGYLRRLCTEGFGEMLRRPPTRRRLELVNGSVVEVLAQSDRAVRGTRVQKLRCDEVELFDAEVWQAAQLATRSRRIAGGFIRGAVEAFSTMHRPGGLMQRMVFPEEPGGGGSPEAGPRRRRFAWCVWDIIATCHRERSCATCPLWEECRGRAKEASGFMAVEDVIAMKRRVSRPTWEHEMLCQPPTLQDAVFPAFRRSLHVRAYSLNGRQPEAGASVVLEGRKLTVETVVAGVDFGFRVFACVWMVMLRDGSGGRVVWVVDEWMGRQRTVERNVAAMRSRSVPFAAGPEAAERPGMRWEPAHVYCDVAGKQTNSQTGQPDEEVLRKAGYRVHSKAMAIDAGLALINELVDPALDGGKAARLWIDPRCVELIGAFEGYRRGPSGRAEKDGQHDHAIDALRYALVNHDRRAGEVRSRTY